MSGTSELVRVPSGNIINEILSLFINSPASDSDRTARALFPRFTKIAPDMVINGPRGVYCNDCFAIIDDCLGAILILQQGEKKNFNMRGV